MKRYNRIFAKMEYTHFCETFVPRSVCFLHVTHLGVVYTWRWNRLLGFAAGHPSLQFLMGKLQGHQPGTTNHQCFAPLILERFLVAQQWWGHFPVTPCSWQVFPLGAVFRVSCSVPSTCPSSSARVKSSPSQPPLPALWLLSLGSLLSYCVPQKESCWQPHS